MSNGTLVSSNWLSVARALHTVEEFIYSLANNDALYGESVPDVQDFASGIRTFENLAILYSEKFKKDLSNNEVK